MADVSSEVILKDRADGLWISISVTNGLLSTRSVAVGYLKSKEDLEDSDIRQIALRIHKWKLRALDIERER
jgi:hypothetical protein